MASSTPHSIENVPLHVIASILGQLDTTQQLKVTASSHSIFRDAFKDNTRSTVYQAAPTDDQAIPRVMENLVDRTSDATLAIACLADLTLADFDFLSRNHTAVKYLGEKFCRDSFPRFAKWLGPKSAHEPAPCDYFRIQRALYRHQIMCNLLCDPLRYRREGHIDDRDRERSMVLLAFSPWVNEQLVCIYYFLQRMVMEAYDDVAAHDITWGELQVSWTDEQWRVGAMEDGVQRYLAQGLEFLSSVAKAESFDERIALLGGGYPGFQASIDDYPHKQISYLMYYCEPWLNEGLDGGILVADAHEEDLLQLLASPLDGPDEPCSSTSFQTWLMAQADRSLVESTFNHESDANLWMCGYVIWEASGLVPADRFGDKIAALRQEKHFFQRLRASYDDATVRRSEDRRADLWLAGAQGYWPLEGIDFSRVQDLDEERKKRVLERWGLNGVI